MTKMLLVAMTASRQTQYVRQVRRHANLQRRFDGTKVLSALSSSRADPSWVDGEGLVHQNLNTSFKLQLPSSFYTNAQIMPSIRPRFYSSSTFTEELDSSVKSSVETSSSTQEGSTSNPPSSNTSSTTATVWQSHGETQLHQDNHVTALQETKSLLSQSPESILTPRDVQKAASFIRYWFHLDTYEAACFMEDLCRTVMHSATKANKQTKQGNVQNAFNPNNRSGSEVFQTYPYQEWITNVLDHWRIVTERLAHRRPVDLSHATASTITTVSRGHVPGSTPGNTNTVANAFSPLEAAQRAESFLFWVQQQQQHQVKQMHQNPSHSNANRRGGTRPLWKVTTKNYNTVIDAWSKCVSTTTPTHKFRNNTKSPERRAQAILHRMEKHHSSHNHHNRHKQNTSLSHTIPPPDGFSYNSVLSAWSRSTHPQAIQYVEKTLQRATQRGCIPDAVALTSVMRAWIHRASHENHGSGELRPFSRWEAAEKCERLLYWMEDVYWHGAAAAGSGGGGEYGEPFNVYGEWGRSQGFLDGKSHSSGRKRGRQHVLPPHTWRDRQQVKPTIVTYASVMDAWSRCSGTADDVQPLGENHAHGRKNHLRKSHMRATPLWKQTAAYRAECILQHVQTLYQNQNNHDNDKTIPQANTSLKPNVICYNTLLAAWSRSPCEEAPHRAEYWLRHMTSQALHHGGSGVDLEVAPDIVSYNSVMAAWSRASQRTPRQHKNWQRHGNQKDDKEMEASPARRAEEWLRLLLQRQQVQKGPHEGLPMVYPDTISFTSVMDAWAKSGEWNAAWRAEEVLRRMIAYSEQQQPQRLEDFRRSAGQGHQGEESGHDGVSVQPNTITYTTVIDAWARDGRRGAAQWAESILLRMKHMHEKQLQSTNARNGGHSQQQALDVKPTMVTYNAVLHAWAHSPDIGSARRAEWLLLSMINSYTKSIAVDKGNKHGKFGKNVDRNASVAAQPNLTSFLCCMEAWSRSVRPARHQRGGSRGSHGDDDSQSRRLDALEAAERAEGLLLQVQRLRDEGVLASFKDDGGKETFMYNLVIGIWAKSGMDTYHHKIDTNLSHVDDKDGIRFEDEDDVQKDEKDCGVRAEHLLRHMQKQTHVSPNIITYNSCLHAWSKSSRPQAAQRATALLREMQSTSDSKVHPDGTTFCTVINAWARSGDLEHKAQRAVALLREMQQQYDAKRGNITEEALSIAYNTTLNACANSRQQDREKNRDVLLQAVALLDEMSAGSSPTQTAAAPTAKEPVCTFVPRPNQLTYSTFLKACHHLTSQDHEDQVRDGIVEAAFRRCIQDGQVDTKVLRNLQHASPNVYNTMVVEKVTSGKAGSRGRWQRDVRSVDLPPSWTRNVKTNGRVSTRGRKV